MVSSEIVNSVGGNESIVRVDPGRISAGIVTGIGFIGAGVIIKLGDLVRGVTTAATIWFVAGLGIAVGEERYLLATIATAAGVVVLALLNSVESLIPGYIYRIVDIDTGREAGGAVLKDVREILQSANIRLMELKATNDAVGDHTKIRVYVRARQNHQALDVVERISRIQGVTRTSWH
jgi:putative Mg2+ transporter-C (MgtC) family protein